MNDHASPLCKRLCNAIHPGLYDMLATLDVSQVLDVPEFTEIRGYEPICGSIFLVGENPGGSYTFDIKFEGKERTVEVHNGTLVRVGNIRLGGYSARYSEMWHVAAPTEAVFDEA